MAIGPDNQVTTTGLMGATPNLPAPPDMSGLGQAQSQKGRAPTPMAKRPAPEKVQDPNIDQKLAKLSEEEDISIECIFTKVAPIEALYSTVNHLFMIQNVINYPKVDNFNCQIWYLGETGVKEIEKHWL